MPRPAKDIPLRDLRTYDRSRAVRLPDCDYAGDEIIHMTLCADRDNPFAEARVATNVIASVEKCCRLCGYDLFGYCLMPDHLHVLLSPGVSGRPISDWLRRFKSFTTNEYAKLGGQAPLWQRSANDHVCRKTETAETVLTYIVNNPVRAELVERWQNWPWTRVFIEM